MISVVMRNGNAVQRSALSSSLSVKIHIVSRIMFFVLVFSVSRHHKENGKAVWQ